MQSSDSYDGINSGFFFDNGVIGKQVSGDNYYCVDYADTTGYFEQSVTGTNSYNSVYGNGGAGGKYRNTRIFENGQIIAFDMGLDGILLNSDNMSEILSADTTGIIRFSQYGTGTKTAASLSKTQSNYIAGFATDGTLLDLERKRDTTIIITNANYDFSAAVTTAQVLSRYNRVVIYIKCTSAATANNTVTLHTPDANLAQTEIIIHSIDDNGTYRNDINFTTNGAVNSLGGTISTYNLSAGEQKRIRVVNDGGWKYFFGY